MLGVCGLAGPCCLAAGQLKSPANRAGDFPTVLRVSCRPCGVFCCRKLPSFRPGHPAALTRPLRGQAGPAQPSCSPLLQKLEFGALEKLSAGRNLTYRLHRGRPTGR